MDRPGSCLAIFCRAERSWTARVRRSKAFFLDHGLAARLPDRGQNLRQAYPDSKPDAKIGVLYQNDDFGKDYLTGLKDVLGADHAGMIVKETSYETSADSRLPSGHAARLGRRCLRHRGDPENRRPGDPQILRSRVESGPLHDRRLAIDRRRHEAGGGREIEGRDYRRLRQGSDRCPLEGRRRLQGVRRIHSQIHVAQRVDRLFRRVWIWNVGDDGPGAQAVRQ